MTERPDDERRTYVGDEPTQTALAASDLRALGVSEPRAAPLVDAAVYTALGTGAGVRLVADGDLPTGGMGAILRWS